MKENSRPANQNHTLEEKVEETENIQRIQKSPLLALHIEEDVQRHGVWPLEADNCPQLTAERLETSVLQLQETNFCQKIHRKGNRFSSRQSAYWPVRW